jgi:hypothetical protein
MARTIGEAADLEISADGTGFRPRRAPDAASAMREKTQPGARHQARGERTHGVKERRQ